LFDIPLALTYTDFHLEPSFITHSRIFAMREMCRDNVVFLVLLIAAFFNSCGITRQGHEMKALSKCEFRYEGIKRATLAGVDVSRVTGLYDLEVDDESTLFAALTFGKLPLDVTVKVGVKNPSQSMAAMDRLEWILLIDGIEMGTGVVTDRVIIAPGGGTAIIPISFSTELVTLLSAKSGDAVMTFGLNLAGTADKPSRITVKVKPTIVVGESAIQYPGYITLNREFSNGELK
jgi:hypothetical protein